ncbi:hypothetical protein [Helicobacter heilmannii]|uniref:Uncharacterized protein n=1 Tax=Helicobacter heilmannii TaxID=35817 RepID=A0A0K2Y846_HELHE|nr:hypothetical protein [Helicobacter heilmannii]BDQ27582.1 hypothetical protein ASB1_12580 [Helicobacter heilmannii]CCM11719.1 hypothetical protein BN341_450 [Helicobacter heilmannii ASB1.4]CRI33859.1 hypothetical protein HHE01_15450 [Helicobacter heilmannii]
MPETQQLQAILEKALTDIKGVLASSFEAHFNTLLEKEKLQIEKQFATRLQEKDKKIANQQKALFDTTTKLKAVKTELGQLKQQQNNEKQRNESPKMAGLRVAIENQQRCIDKLKARLKQAGLEDEGVEAEEGSAPNLLELQERIAHLEQTIKAQNYHIQSQRNLILGYQEQFENTGLPWDTKESLKNSLEGEKEDKS